MCKVDPVCKIKTGLNPVFIVGECVTIFFMSDSTITVGINTPFIYLVQFLKIAGICATGGEAKGRIDQEHVQVNDDICTQKKRRLSCGDRVRIDGQMYRVKIE